MLKGGKEKMKSLLKSKSGQLGGLQSIVITLVIVGIILGVGFMVLQEFMGQMEAGSDAEAGVNATIQAVNKIPTWLPIIVILSIVGIILAIVFTVMPRAQTMAGGAI